MKTITINRPPWIKSGLSQWLAVYQVSGCDAFSAVAIESRSSLFVTIGKWSGNFYISCPTYQCSIPAIDSLEESFWICEKLIAYGVPKVDAVTIAQVLEDVGQSKEG